MSALASRRTFLASALGLAFLPGYARAAKSVEGVAIADDALVAPGSPKLSLVGAGAFRFLFRRYYVCSLYALPGLRKAPAILQADAPRRVGLHALRRITSFEFLWGLDKGIADNASRAELKTLAPQLEQLRDAIRRIGAIADGAQVSIDYAPRSGTSILVDNEARGDPVPGKALNDAVLRVWIGENPLDAGLKEALLGG